MKYSEDYKRRAVAVYDAARRAGASAADAARKAGHSSGILHHWRSEFAAAGSDDGPRHIVKKRDCLRCGHGFKSSWNGERICGRCKAGERVGDGLPESWGATATMGVVD